ncbi:hypothetical protein Vadar_006167 [Vaccinium darrowii]|uniref:Uncharacterized protein n=1 Tax=Vaccinium darrowii TaxID=229202 RepID=A0ACB7XPP0_9ERIC|nr:hypothetical protein Vadar_006167 [Vaccinium darrowii]
MVKGKVHDPKVNSARLPSPTTSPTRVAIGGDRSLKSPNPELGLLHNADSPSGSGEFDNMEAEKYSEELDVAVRAVHLACSLCQRVQEGLVSTSSDHVKSKDDDSPVTVADWSVQAMISWILSEHFGSHYVSIVAEEDVESLSNPDSAADSLGNSQVLDAISRCNSSGGPTGRHWVLDPVDGTLGFVRGDQYAIALALIEDGKVVIGVLGCPNYPMRKEWLNYHHQHYRAMTESLLPSPLSWEEGCVMYARKGSGKAWMQPLIHGDEKLEWPNFAKSIQVSSVDDPAQATFCESMERANTNHSFTAGLAHSVGLRKEPLRVYSMVKYAAIARGDAEIFMKFARAGYKEKIWDHAAGVLIVQEAGGVVTDAGGRHLDFSKGMYLEGLDRGIIACCGVPLHDKIVGAIFASWDSSNL